MLEIKQFDDAQVVLLREMPNGKKSLIATLTSDTRLEDAKVMARAFDSDKLEFTVNEQNFLAQVMQEISTLAYKARGSELPSDEELAKVGDAIAWAAVQFPSVNVWDLYDKFHRQGKNR